MGRGCSSRPPSASSSKTSGPAGGPNSCPTVGATVFFCPGLACLALGLTSTEPTFPSDPHDRAAIRLLISHFNERTIPPLYRWYATRHWVVKNNRIDRRLLFNATPFIVLLSFTTQSQGPNARGGQADQRDHPGGDASAGGRLRQAQHKGALLPRHDLLAGGGTTEASD